MNRTQLKKGFKNPTKIPGFLTRKISDIWGNLKWERYRKKEGIPLQKKWIHDLVEQDEFVLIILDSCRFDYFKEIYERFIDGDLYRVWSAGNSTPWWTPNTWDQKYNIDYISGISFPVSKHAYNNTYSSFDPESTFNEAIHVSYPNELLSTVPPELMTDIALHHFSKTTHLRGVVHYSQPHRPYIGEKKLLPWRVRTKKLKDISDRLGFRCEIPDSLLAKSDYLMGEELVELNLDEDKLEKIPKERYEVRERIADGRLSDKELREAYRDNLICALSEVKRLIEYLDCIVIISADHGEHLGGYTNELPRYNHPNRTHRVLREVPWLLVETKSENKKELSDFETNSNVLEVYNSSESKKEVQEHLRALGYIE